MINLYKKHFNFFYIYVIFVYTIKFEKKGVRISTS